MDIRHLYSTMGAWAIFGIIFIALLPHPAHAAMFNCQSGDVDCLIDAINAANATQEPDTIDLEPGVYSLTQVNNHTDGSNGLPSITSDISIRGTDANTTTIERRLPTFTMIALPDTQFYTSSLRGGSPAIFHVQTQWIVDHKDDMDIVFVTQLGDCVQNGDDAPDEWLHAEQAMSLLEDQATTGLRDGIPYGIAVGNHDQGPPSGTTGKTDLYNQFFGEQRFLGRTYYGGHFGVKNDNHFELFSAGSLDFIVIHLEFDVNMALDGDVLRWADSMLQAHSHRRGIIVY